MEIFEKGHNQQKGYQEADYEGEKAYQRRYLPVRRN